jgi:hypothetical protein
MHTLFNQRLGSRVGLREVQIIRATAEDPATRESLKLVSW